MEKSFTPEIYNKLVEAVDNLPTSAVERSKGTETRKGYDTTGYQYQFLVNILNEIVGVPNWSAEYSVVKEIEGAYNTGQKNWEITVDMKVTILDAVRNSAGGHKSVLHCDALKGAVTSALKKTLGLFGIGKKAYEGTLDDDYKPLPDDNGFPKISIPDKKTESVAPPQAKSPAPKKPAPAQKPETKAPVEPEVNGADIMSVYGARESVGKTVKCVREKVAKITTRNVKNKKGETVAVVDYLLRQETLNAELKISMWGVPNPKISAGTEADFFDVKMTEWQGEPRGHASRCAPVKK